MLFLRKPRLVHAQYVIDSLNVVGVDHIQLRRPVGGDVERLREPTIHGGNRNARERTRRRVHEYVRKMATE